MNEVKSPKKPLLYYYLLMLLVLLLFNLLAMPWISEHQIKEVDYNTFVSMVEKKEIGKVDIQEQDAVILLLASSGKKVKPPLLLPAHRLCIFHPPAPFHRTRNTFFCCPCLKKFP